MFITEAQVLSIMFQAPTQIGGHTYDSKGYLFSGQSADCNIDAIIGRNLGRKNKPLRVRFDLIDEKAKAHRVTATLLPN
ncbi:hypothetical protein ASD39_07330 [Sphingomonas sp. Root50]|nr:hypothetical protein ASD17_05790 [Sphingomonas sp. Root1294]KQY67734.1 hypothetical protein ASD39_07330 [Sphingomonas sp. Root50]KRB88678.1 hypothetical protein ASE22_19795 [Sphingomonas sp. Root720]